MLPEGMCLALRHILDVSCFAPEYPRFVTAREGPAFYLVK